MFETEISEVFNNKYIKVFLKDNSKLQNVSEFLQDLDCVKKANVTDGKSLTVYPAKAWKVEDVKKEIGPIRQKVG